MTSTPQGFIAATEDHVDRLNRAIALHRQGNIQSALQIYQQLAAERVALAEPYSNQALIFSDNLNENLNGNLNNKRQQEQALKLWGTALLVNPNHVESLAQLGRVLKSMGEMQHAEQCYRRALEIEPGLAEVHYNFANLLRDTGRDTEAAEHYRMASTCDPELALSHYNLGNLQRDQGELEEAMNSYRRAIEVEPSNALFHNNLGNALTQRDDLDAAADCYRRALELQPDYADAIYNLGNALYLQGELAAAQPLFEQAGIRDWRARSLYCSYKLGDTDAFNRQLQDCEQAQHLSPQVAALSAHNAFNLGLVDNYRFCPNPLDFIFRASLPALAGAQSSLRQDLLHTISTVAMDCRHQGRLHNGVQSAGNLFQRTESSLQELAQLLRQQFARYREHFTGESCTLISHFPTGFEFESAWSIQMRQGGHLDGHIHETGWLSGVVYLALPPCGESGDEGQIAFSLHGDNYPRQRQDFPGLTLPIEVGDVVLFPSSLFHRTIPYSSSQERVCIAFDLKPETRSAP